MKHLLMLFAAIFLSASISNSQILFEENFSYAAGDSLQMHGWVVHSGATGPWTVVTPGLSFTNYPLSGIGNACQTDIDGFQDVNKNFTEQTTGTVYTSMMVSVISATATGDYFYHIGNTTLGSTFRGKVFAKSDGASGFFFGVSKVDNSGTALYETTSRNFNTTYLLVMKYVLGAGGTDEASLFVFNTSAPMTEPPTPTIGPDDRGSNLDNAGTVALRQGATTARPQLVVDGIRIAMSWADIMTNIEPVSFVADRFELSQNYPNPFNPSTKIRFSTPANGFATMKVFNMLGQEVSTLVNTQLNVGVHEIDFNAVGIPSGVYFYSVEFSGNDGSFFKDSKKFILSK